MFSSILLWVAARYQRYRVEGALKRVSPGPARGQPRAKWFPGPNGLSVVPVKDLELAHYKQRWN